MNLNNPSIRKEFITHIYNILPKNSKNEIFKPFLNEFLDKITDETKEFPISVIEMANWLSIQKSNVVRMIDENYTKEKDYIMVKEERKTKPITDYFLTIACFQDVCLRMKSEKSKLIRIYFITIEKAYREWFSETVYDRRKFEDFAVTKEKIEQEEEFDLPDEPLVYEDEIKQRGVTYKKWGHTKNGNIRIQQLKAQYPGQHKVSNFKVTNHPQALEECLHRLAEKWRVPCTGSPCPTEIFYSDGFDSKSAMDACVKGQSYTDTLFKTMSQSKLKEPNSLQKSKLYFKTKKTIRDLQTE